MSLTPTLPVTATDIIQELSALGTPQNQKIYLRHGAKDPVAGVSFKNIGMLKKRYKKHAALAPDLWASNLHEARLLALMIADPELPESTLDAWANALDNYIIADELATFVSKTPHAPTKLHDWIHQNHEFTAQCGWVILSHLALAKNDLPDTYFTPYLNHIKTHLHSSANRVRHAMNQALIVVGVRSAGLHAQALVIAEHLGEVQVDHGQTGCKTPDAKAYIARTLARKGYVRA